MNKKFMIILCFFSLFVYGNTLAKKSLKEVKTYSTYSISRVEMKYPNEKFKTEFWGGHPLVESVNIYDENISIYYGDIERIGYIGPTKISKVYSMREIYNQKVKEANEIGTNVYKFINEKDSYFVVSYLKDNKIWYDKYIFSISRKYIAPMYVVYPVEYKNEMINILNYISKSFKFKY